MLSRRVTVLTRRFDRSADETITLEFSDGLHERPILYVAESHDRRTSGGTTVHVELDIDVIREAQLHSKYNVRFWENAEKNSQRFIKQLGATFPVSDVAILVITPYHKTLIDGRDWESEPAETLLERIEGNSSPLFRCSCFFAGYSSNRRS